jgi:mannose-6-phosphate isomerase-like protein (cupin superfamily)
MADPIQPLALAARLSELWSPAVIGEVDDSYLKVAKVHGEFGWHAHTDEDELFLVLQGRLRIEFEDDAVELGPGEIYVVAKGRRHNPVAAHETLVMLLERKSTLHTGDTISERTRSIADQLRAYATPPRA